MEEVEGGVLSVENFSIVQFYCFWTPITLDHLASRNRARSTLVLFPLVYSCKRSYLLLPFLTSLKPPKHVTCHCADARCLLSQSFRDC